MVSGDESNDHSDSDPNQNKEFNPYQLKEYENIEFEIGELEQSLKAERSLGEDIGDYEWKITSVNVYRTDGLPIFSADYGSDLSQFDSNVVMQFHDTVQKFAEENLGTQFIDFKVNEERVFFKINEKYDHIYLITAILGNKVRSGLNAPSTIHIDSLITDITSLIIFYDQEGEIEENFDLNEAIAEMVADVDQLRLEKDEKQLIDDFTLSYAVITDDAGVPVLSRSYGDDTIFKDDPMVFSMFLHALNVFFNTNFSTKLREINFGNSRLYVTNKFNHFFALVIEFDDYIEIREDSRIHLLSEWLLSQMAEMIHDLGEDVLFDIEDEAVELMVDSLVFKGMVKMGEVLE